MSYYDPSHAIDTRRRIVFRLCFDKEMVKDFDRAVRFVWSHISNPLCYRFKLLERVVQVYQINSK